MPCRIGGVPNRKIVRAQSVLLVNRAQPPALGRGSILLPPIPAASTDRGTSADTAGHKRVPQQPERNLDLVPTPAGKMRPRDQMRLPPDCSVLGAIHTRL